MLKSQLLQRFRLTEVGYLKNFKSSKLELGEIPDQFGERLRRYLIQESPAVADKPARCETMQKSAAAVRR